MNSVGLSITFNTCIQIGRALNLREHHVRNTEYMLPTPVDLEAHIGKDGRMYLVDFGFAGFLHKPHHTILVISPRNRRLYPPQDPNSLFAGKNRHLYQLFRPEFVVGFRLPLCSDGFSTFIQRGCDVRTQEEDEINKEVCQQLSGKHNETHDTFVLANRLLKPQSTFKLCLSRTL